MPDKIGARPRESNQREQSARFLTDAVQPADLRLAREGWVRRFLADRHRTEEALELYSQMGYEVRAEPLGRDDLPEACEDCQLAVLFDFRVIYTREKS
jgi:hypothetical protein